MYPTCVTRARRCAVAALTLFVLSTTVLAQVSATGGIEGRVLNPRNGEYLENARVTVEASGLTVFTESDGFYRFSQVPAGPARLKIFYTGLPTQTEDVVVTA